MRKSSGKIGKMEEIWYTYTGDIDSKLVADAINWINSNAYSGKVKKLKFFISSGGGDIDSAVRLHDFLIALPFEVDTIGFGQVDSAAITVFLSGKERSAVKGCRFFVHEGSYHISPDSVPIHIIEERVGLIKKIRDKHLDILIHAAGKKGAELAKIVGEGKPLTEVQAKDFGLVTAIIEKLPRAPSIGSI